MKRRLRIRFAVLSALVIAFAQIAVAAQPWPPAAAPHQHSAVSSAVDVPEHCAAFQAEGDSAPAPNPNFCEVHCQDAAQPDALVVVVAAPIPDAGLAVPLAEAAPIRHGVADTVDAKCASPPARLLFARFLI
jgi:hypothetical protein